MHGTNLNQKELERCQPAVSAASLEAPFHTSSRLNGKVCTGRWIEDGHSVGSDAASGQPCRYQTADSDGNAPGQLTTRGERHVCPARLLEAVLHPTTVKVYPPSAAATTLCFGGRGIGSGREALHGWQWSGAAPCPGRG